MELGIAILSVVIFVYTIVAKRLAATALTGPMVFVTFGWLVGEDALDLIEPERDLELIKFLFEATLVLVLFNDALVINLSRWRQQLFIPARLLGIGLPLTILSGWAIAAALLTDLDVWEAAVVAVLLAPTDAALGEAVVSNRRVPGLIRHGLSVESGLNDGIALPVFFIFLALAERSQDLTTGAVLGEIANEVLVAVAIGVVVGWTGCRLIRHASQRGWVGASWRQLALVVLALAAWAFSESFEASGFLAAWTAGFVAGHVLRDSYPGVDEYCENSAHLLTLVSFFIFGSVALVPAINGLTWQIALYALLSLTAIRLVPVGLAMLGGGLRPPSVLYLAWFGPRGLASIILAAIVVEETELAGASTIVDVMAITVGLSVLAHGVTAWWGSNRYVDWFERTKLNHAAMREADEAPSVPALSDRRDQPDRG